MPTSTQRRWICPQCGSGALAPSKPRRDDVRRYCLDCSQETGRLVERTCPALDKQRAVAKTRTAEKTTQKREREQAAKTLKHMAGGVDLLVEAKRFWALPTMKDARKRYRPKNTKLPTFTWRQSATKRHSGGTCWPWNQHIVITIGSDVADAVGTLLHELVHAVLPDGEHHGSLFRSTLRSAATEAWPNGFARLRGDVIVRPNIEKW